MRRRVWSTWPRRAGRRGSSVRAAVLGEVEVDECYIGGFEAGKQGRGTGEKALVGVAIEVRGRGSGRVRLRALPDVSGATLRAFVTDAVAPGAIVHTDGWQGYRPLG